MYKLYKYSIWPSLTIQHYPLLLQKQIMSLFHSEPFTGSPAYLFIYFYSIYLFIFLTEWHVGSWFHDQGLNLCPLQWKRGVLTTGPPGKSPSANLKLKPKSFMMAWRAPQGLALVFSVTSFATTVIACSCCHPGFLAVPKICQMCSCLRAFALAVLFSLT